jgi:radical SAM protein with 4Fe4S-binding SPASM domain
MAWNTEYLRESTRALAQLDGEYPYLSALVSSRPADTDTALARLDNYLRARLDERQQPQTVASLPYHVVLDPSNVCNLACPLCVQATDPHGRTRTMIDLKDFARLLGQLNGHVIRLDLFNWGEPLLHPHFSEIVQMAASRSLHTRTSSHFSHKNGIEADRLVASGLRYLVVSVDGATQETYERYRVKGHLEYVLRNLKELVAARERAGSVFPLIEWQYLVMEHNEGEIEGARELASELGVDIFRYGGARGRMSTKVLTDTPTNISQSRDLLLDAAHPLSEYDESGEKRRVEEKRRCNWLWGKVALHPDGGISPCWSSWFQQNDFGNWMSGDLHEIWNGQNYRQARHSACHGGKPDAATNLVCDTCAFNRSFVPTPDGDREPLPDARHLSNVVRLLEEACAPPNMEVVRALTNYLQQAA